MEADLLILSFLVHFAWELIQAPLFSSLDDERHVVGVLICLQATLGDLGIALAAFWTAAITGGGRDWIARPKPRAVATFLVVGLGVTIGSEFISTEILDRWAYAVDWRATLPPPKRRYRRSTLGLTQFPCR